MNNIIALTGENIFYSQRLVIRFPICEPPLLILAATKRIREMMIKMSCKPFSFVELELDNLVDLQAQANGESVSPLPKDLIVGEQINRLSSQDIDLDHATYREISNESKLPTFGISENLEVIRQKTIELSRRITERSKKISEILSWYQTQSVTDYEIERSIRTLHGLFENDEFFAVHGKVDSIAVMLPSNLPLYSLIVFAVIPSMQSELLFVRPNTMLQEHNIISRIFDELELETLFSNIKVINQDHRGFEDYIKESSLVVFTGKPSNADKFIKKMKENSLLIINGAGHNPLVVTDTADIEQAVNDAVLLKGFNGGQDCAGPDAILVHHSVAVEFIKKFQERYSSLKIGLFQQKDTIIGPIHRVSELHKFAELLHQHSKDIIAGGMIDYKNSIVYPTTIVRGIERYPNFKEIYGPIAFIHPYTTDEDLSYYFQDIDGLYNANRMYVTVYGHSEYLSSRDDTSCPGKQGNVGVILHAQTIHDIEIGYKHYGGYSLGASGIVKKASTGIQRVAMPILLPQIISEYLLLKKELPFVHLKQDLTLQSFSLSIKKGREIDPIIGEFQLIAQNIFSENLLFGFVFGSAAKGKLIVQGKNRDDLDTFICLKEEDPGAMECYQIELAKLHQKYNLQVDTIFPAEIMTFVELKAAIEHTNHFDISIEHKIEGKDYDYLFWAHAISDKKIGFIGNGKVLSSFIKESRGNIYRWRDQIIQQLQIMDVLPDYLILTFSGLSKEDVMYKLSQSSPHLVVHLGLNYASENSSEKTMVAVYNPRFFSHVKHLPGFDTSSQTSHSASDVARNY